MPNRDKFRVTPVSQQTNANAGIQGAEYDLSAKAPNTIAFTGESGETYREWYSSPDNFVRIDVVTPTTPYDMLQVTANGQLAKLRPTSICLPDGVTTATVYVFRTPYAGEAE